MSSARALKMPDTAALMTASQWSLIILATFLIGARQQRKQGATGPHVRSNTKKPTSGGMNARNSIRIRSFAIPTFLRSR